LCFCPVNKAFFALKSSRAVFRHIITYISALRTLCLLVALVPFSLVATPVWAASQKAVSSNTTTSHPSQKVRKSSASKKSASKKKTSVKKAVSSSSDPSIYYQHAFATINAGKPDLAETLASRGSDPVLNKVLRGYAMALPGNSYCFSKLEAFMLENPSWPGLKGIQMIAEQKIPASMAPNELVSWFSKFEPITLVGFYSFVDALNQMGYEAQAIKFVRNRWINDVFTANEQTAFYARFASLLNNEDIWARVNRHIWKDNQTQVRRMMPLLNATDRTVVEAWLALANDERGADTKLDRIPSDARNEPILLYQKLRRYVKSDNNEAAKEIRLNAPSELGDATAWWEQSHILIRRAIERHDYATAYRLASDHGQTDPRPLVQAEFLSGWLALRFLNRPDVALRHFKNLYNNASTPISRARGAYWLGRTHEALGDKNEAEQAYEDAAVFSTTYYGQLATTRIYAKPKLVAQSDPPIPQNVREAFMAQDIIRAIEKLAKIGADEKARIFFHAALKESTKRADFILMTELAEKMRRPDLSIYAVKAAYQKNILVLNGGFPLLSVKVQAPPEPAFTHALIRQESMFNPHATSSAGARGLMQLMPRTAKDVCRKIGIRYYERMLDDPTYNIQLGTAFVQKQIDRFDGSYILALAGYNAGPSRVLDWIELFGDPRSPDVDPIDWIEMLPIQETRNYVQRIMESVQVYRAKLSGGKSSLLILNDLKR